MACWAGGGMAGLAAAAAALGGLRGSGSRVSLSSSSGTAVSSCRGFDSLGSRPSFMARRMRAAFHFANLIFFWVSSSRGVKTLMSWKKVAAASNVSAVWLGRRGGGGGWLAHMYSGRRGWTGGWEGPRRRTG